MITGWGREAGPAVGFGPEMMITRGGTLPGAPCHTAGSTATQPAASRISLIAASRVRSTPSAWRCASRTASGVGLAHRS